MSDLRFLPQLLTLYGSLRRRESPFTLTVLCLDARTERYLEARRLPSLHTLGLAELEAADPDLTAVRRGRSWTEYCWTATPAFCHYALRLAPPGAVRVWIDADVEFLGDPASLLEELGDGSVLLTPHRYTQAYPLAAPATALQRWYGRFNGGSIAFRRDAAGLAAVQLWRERTIAWCAERPQPGRFGNQLHLDDFPVSCTGVRIAAVPATVLGPWNGGGFQIRRSADGVSAHGAPVIAYHYQSLRVGVAHRPRLAPPNSARIPVPGGRLEARVMPHYRVTPAEWRIFWRPHLERLGQSVADVLSAEPAYAHAIAPPLTARQLHAQWRTYAQLQRSRVVDRLGVS